MVASLLLRGHPLIRLGLRNRGLCTGILQVTRRSCCTAMPASTPPGGGLSSAENTTSVLSTTDPPKYQRWDEPGYRKWKNQEEEILSDIDPIISLTKEILHSNRYVDGERLTFEDEKIVVDRLLAHHPHAEDKIGCGLESIMALCDRTSESSFFFATFFLLGEEDLMKLLDWKSKHCCSCVDIVVVSSENLMK
ncbi:protein DCL, chloroplastic-like isoform X2 [Cucurbita maxima]|uniref:Protein DCL, chloroplastic-like isoform X2 n=1 Tax=Cucurbita maxima TaxID=3661 RepID=A0A6J1J443_CUCMA|nr:protein DCL, chloroplastic-like isoform X2 [Cucurbita maxima]